ncbi:MAG: hypothetical protein R3Y54_12480 [Eubacteriales bacterium]
MGQGDKERMEYDYKIMDTEKMIEKVLSEKNVLQESLECLSMNLQHGFRELIYLNEELMRKGDDLAQVRQGELEEKNQLMNQLFYNSKGDLEDICRKECYRLENVLDQLHQEKEAIPWD